jgi:hypothetical protein
MKTNCLLVVSVLVWLIALSESAWMLFRVQGLLLFVGQLETAGWKGAADLQVCTWVISPATTLLVHTGLWGARPFLLLVVHAAIWVVKTLLFAAVFSSER